MADDYAELKGPFRRDVGDATYEYAPGRNTQDANYASIETQPAHVAVNPDLTREDAETLLRKHGMEEGSYVVRPSSSHPGSYALCVVAEGAIKHYPVERLTQYPYDGQFLVLCPGERRRFASLAEVVSYYSFKQGGLAIKLTKRIA